jgi:hypothetical protein
MKLLTAPKAKYLLEGGLEVLHSQSIEWLSEVAFWRDEAAFFHELVAEKTKKPMSLKAKDSFQKIESELVKLKTGELDELEDAVEAHEVYLDKLMQNIYKDEESYREKHRALTYKFHITESQIKKLKKEVFKLSKLIHETELVS